MTCDICKYYSEKVQEVCPFCSDKEVIEKSGCLTIQEAKDLSHKYRGTPYDTGPWVEAPVSKAQPGTTIPIAEGSFFGEKARVSLLPRPEVKYVDPEVYSAVGFRVVCNPGNIHCITASSPELAQRVAELLNQDGWNAKKAQLQTKTHSGAGSD